MGRFIPNPHFVKQLVSQPEMVAFVEVKAHEVEENIRSFAPIGESHEYIDSIRTVAGLRGGMAIGRVLSTDFKWHWIEFGTGEPGPTPAFAPFRKGLDATSGIRVVGLAG